jgi:hypothetical protein
MTSPGDFTLGQRRWTANPNIPIQRCGTVGFTRGHAEEDVNEESTVQSRRSGRKDIKTNTCCV